MAKKSAKQSDTGSENVWNLKTVMVHMREDGEVFIGRDIGMTDKDTAALLRLGLEVVEPAKAQKRGGKRR